MGKDKKKSLKSNESKKGDQPVCYQNRELSWLSFNERVLDEAGNSRVPLAERLTFASIYQTNLDEFFMVRVGTLMTQLMEGDDARENKLNMSCSEQVKAIFKRVKQLEKKKAKIYEQLMGELEPRGIRIINFNKLSEAEGKLLEKYFDSRIVPYLSPIIVGNGTSFPFLNNKGIYAGAMLLSKTGKRRIGIVACFNEVFKRLIEIPTRPGYYMLCEELILHFISKLFPRYTLQEKSLIRITRNADIDADEIYDEEQDFRSAMEILISRRTKLNPVRIEISRELDTDLKKELASYLDVKPSHIVKVETPLDLSFVFQIQGTLHERFKEQSGIFYSKRNPRLSPDIDMRRSMMDQVMERDRLLAYPYESMRPFISLLNEAAEDNRVESIKITLYRVAERSKIVDALVEAAENGKDVTVVIELRARFDEANNIETSRILEDAGCKILYGPEGYKVHSKLCLITLKDGEEEKYISQIGTGNYNEKTAALYTDLCLMTADKSIGENAAAIFESLVKGELLYESKELLVAPNCLQSRIIELIDSEIAKAMEGRRAFIGVKINSLTDKVLIDKLIEASKAGVKIKLIIRGICCILPGIEGMTDNIRVVSVVGRFLEHSRIYRFGTDDEEEIYISSADFMTRNTTRRVEVAAPIKDKDIKDRVRRMFDGSFEDTEKGRELNSSGEYMRRWIIDDSGSVSDCMINSQEEFYAEAYEKWKEKQDTFYKK